MASTDTCFNRITALAGLRIDSRGKGRNREAREKITVIIQVRAKVNGGLGQGGGHGGGDTGKFWIRDEGRSDQWETGAFQPDGLEE